MKIFMRALILLMLVAAGQSHAAVTFRQMSSDFFKHVAPGTSPSFTPVAGDTVVVFAQSFDASTPVTGLTGTGTYTPLGSQHTDLDNDANAFYVNASASAGAQTFTIAATGAPTIVGQFVDYSGVGGESNPIYIDHAAPGTAAGAITGTAVTVPINGVLDTWCYNSSGNAATITGTGTQRGQNTAATNNVAWVMTEYAGTGASITPSCTTSVGGDNYEVIEIVFSAPAPPAPGAGIAVGYSVWTGQTSAATSITSVGGTTQATGSTFVTIVDNRSAAVPTLTDNFGNTWIQAHTVNSYSVATITFYYCINCVGGAGYAVTATWSAPASISGIGLVEFENVGAATLDSNPSAFFDQSDTMSTAAPTLVTTAPSELVVSAFGTENSAFDTITDSGVGFSIVVSQGTGMHGPNGAISWALPAGSSTTAAEIFGHSANDYAGAFTLSIKSGAAPPVTAPPTLPVTGLLGIG